MYQNEIVKNLITRHCCAKLYIISSRGFIRPHYSQLSQNRPIKDLMESILQRFKFKTPARLKSQSGQGVLEYILVLVVTVAIVVGLLWRFSDAFRAWGNNYFGEYLACLLETGELPTIGGTGGGAGVCNQYFEPFSPIAGRPPKPGTGQGGSEKGDSSNTSSTRKKSTGGGGGNAGRVSGGGTGSNRFRANNNSGETVRGADGRIKPAKDTYTGSTESSMPAGIYSNQSDNNRTKFRSYAGITGFAPEKNEVAAREAKISVKTAAGGKKDQRKMLVKRNLASAKELETNDDMSFGDFLRILVIAAIIIALVIFIGGQALQVGKSMD